MTFSRTFYRTTAVCSFISIATTLALILLPRVYGSLDSFEQRIGIINNPVYTLRAWAYLLHPFVVIAAALGVAAALRRVASGALTAGFLGFMLWAFTEAVQQVLTLVAFRRWASAFVTADTATREVLRVQIGTYDAIWDALFLLLVIGFFVGSAFYGWVTIKRQGFDRVLGIFYLAVAFLTATTISGELGGPKLPPALDMWLYPIVQPLTRLLIGLWLWRANDSVAGPASSP